MNSTNLDFYFYAEGELSRFDLKAIVEKIIDERHCSSPFLTSGWFSAWIDSLNETPAVFVMTNNNHHVGFAVVGEKIRKRFGLTIRTALLNQTGSQPFDQPWIEHNEVFCPNQLQTIFIKKLAEELRRKSFDRLIISMMSKQALKGFHQSLGPPEKLEYVEGYQASLEPFLNDEYPTFLSKNTRNQLKRSNKLLFESSENVKVAVCINEKRDFLSRLADHHIKRWGKSEFGSGFTNPSFNDFINNFVFKSGKNVELVRVVGTSEEVGYSLNFIDRETVYFYCGGVNVALSSTKVKPGYSMHYAMMKHYAKRGLKKYDFLGGNARYKNSLSSEIVEFCTAEWALSYKKILIRFFRSLTSSV